jgi:hypothetical protein
VVYRDVTRQAKGLYRLKLVGALRIGLTYLSRYNSGWFCHKSKKCTSAMSRQGTASKSYLVCMCNLISLITLNIYFSLNSKKRKVGVRRRKNML